MKKTITEKVLQANRANSLKSTGPKSETGKRNSARNAEQHGMCSSSVVITWGPNAENPEEYQRLFQGMLDYWRPQGAMEVELLKDITNTVWRRARSQRYETGSLMHSTQQTLQRLDADVRQSVRRGEGTLASRTRLGMQLVRDTIADILDELNAGHFLTDDIIADIRKFFPADFADDFTAENTKLIALANEDDSHDSTGTQASATVRERMIANLKALPLDEWQKAADDNHEYQLTLSKCLSSIPDEAALRNILRYETSLNRHLDRTIKRLQELQRTRRERSALVPLEASMGE